MKKGHSWGNWKVGGGGTLCPPPSHTKVSLDARGDTCASRQDAINKARVHYRLTPFSHYQSLHRKQFILRLVQM